MGHVRNDFQRTRTNPTKSPQLRPGLPKSDPKYGARGRSARRLVLGEKIAQPSGPYHQTRQDVKPQAPSCPVLRKPRVLAHRGRKVGPMAVG